ncbi:MAG: pyrroline-5-carboxylate reductase [Lawsonibacter sp.]
MFQSIGFIGTGHMGGALARGAAKGAAGSPIYLANRSPEKAQKLARELDCKAVDNLTIFQQCNLIFLGVKPQRMGDLLAEYRSVLAERKDRFVLASMAAGLSTRTIQEMAGGKYPVIRLLPNTPVAVGAGVIQYCGLDTTEEELKAFEALMAPAGLVDQINEDLCDAASALSGCGPAFCALLIEALSDGGVACGLPREKAQLYTAQMVKGAAKLMLETGIHPGDMKDGVCSPGGTTIQGIRILEEQGFRAAAMNAVIAAYERTLQLGKKE